MSQKQRFVFLSADFYNAYPATQFPEIEQKVQRPYIQVLTVVNGHTFAIPFRSNINHPHAIWTDKQNRCGLDLSKAVVVTEDKYIDKTRSPHIRQNEFDALRGKDYRIKQSLIRYIEKYKAAKADSGKAVNDILVSRSTLQYFEDYMY